MKTDSKTKRKYCKMHYPQPFRSSLALSEKSGRAEYRRLDNEDNATIKCKNGENKTVETTIDNPSIVPYNPYLIMKYDCHICVDMVTGRAVIAYLYKYAYKPADSTRAKITYNGNEIEAYRSVRYISSSEATWNILDSGLKSAYPPSFYYIINNFQFTFKESNELCSMKQTLPKSNDP